MLKNDGQPGAIIKTIEELPGRKFDPWKYRKKPTKHKKSPHEDILGLSDKASALTLNNFKENEF